MAELLRRYPILIVTIVLTTLCTIAIFALVVQSAPFKVCLPAEAKDFDRFQKTIGALDSVIDLSIKLATTLVGFGTAIVIGLKSGMRLTLSVKVVIVSASLFFVQSALYAVWWRMGVAELWLNECLELVAHPRLTSRYAAHFYAFIAGLISMGLIVVGAICSQPVERGNKT